MDQEQVTLRYLIAGITILGIFVLVGIQSSCVRHEERLTMKECISNSNHVWTEKGACVPIKEKE